MTEVVKLDWQEVQRLVQEIARKMQLANWKPDMIIGVERGGLVASVMLSHYLEVPHETVKVSLRDENGECESLTWAPELVLDEDKKILIVDDINDTGATQKWLREDWSASVRGVDPYFADNFWGDSIRWASLIDNESSSENCNFAGRSINKKDHDVWIDFPWESWWNRSTL